MAETEQVPEESAPPSGVSTLTQIIVSLGVVTALASAALLTALAGAMHAPGAGQVYALGAIAAIVGVTVILPAGFGGWGLSTLRKRGIKIRVVRTVGGVTFLWNAIILGIGFTVEKPWTPAELAFTHSKWIPLAAMDKTPMDESALPDATLLAARSMTVENTRDLSALLTNESAAGLAVKWLRIRDKQLTGDHVEQLYTMFGIDREMLVEKPKSLEADVVPRGRDLLYEVSEIVDLGADSHLKWRDPSRSEEPIEEVAASLDAEAIDNGQIMVRVDADTNLDILLEEGSWRLHLADYSDLVGEDRATSKEDKEDGDSNSDKEDKEDKEDAEDPEEPEESEEHAAVRAVFLQSAAGRAGHLAVTTAFDSGWPGSLTNEAAAGTALDVLKWCAGPAPEKKPEAPAEGEEPKEGEEATEADGEDEPRSADPIFDREYESLRSDYGLKDGEFALTDALTATLVPRGRKFMGEVLEMCGPVKRRRQVEQSQSGFEVPDARRMRWAELDAADLAERATIEDGGAGLKKIVVDGAEFEVLMEDGKWRVVR